MSKLEIKIIQIDNGFMVEWYEQAFNAFRSYSIKHLKYADSIHRVHTVIDDIYKEFNADEQN